MGPPCLGRRDAWSLTEDPIGRATGPDGPVWTERLHVRYRVASNTRVAVPPACMPAITRTAVGELICAFSTCWEPFPRGGELRLVRSRDEGRTWSHPEVVWRSPDPRVSILTCVG